MKIAMDGMHFDIAEYLVTLKPRIPLFLSANNPIVAALVNRQFKLATNMLRLLNDRTVPNEDGYTLLHHLFVNYRACADADTFFTALVEYESHGSKFTEKLTCFEETALDLAVMLKTDALQLASRYLELFDFNLVLN